MTKKQVVSGRDIKGYAPQAPKQVIVGAPDEREMAVFKALQAGMPVMEAMKKAGFNLPEPSAEKYAARIHEKYNDRMKNAYESLAVTPEFLAGVHKNILTGDGKDADKLKAIDQILNIQGGYAPKQVEVSQKTFEQAVIEIGQIVNINGMKASDIKQLFAEDAEIVCQP